MMQQLSKHHPVSGRRTAGFTLIELMISIAMVLLLVAGINAVFQAATKTTGTGMAVEEMTRSMRGTERLLDRDFSHAVPLWEMPCLTIHSMQQFAFRNRDDMNNDPDGRPDTIDLNGDGREGNIPAESIYANPFTYNDRNHRIDRIGFFARDVVTPFTRQTGDLPPLNSNKDPLIASEKSSEAWIWYGHLRVPTMPGKANDVVKSHGGTYYNPGEANPQNNAHNYFLNDWCFGRMAILLKDIGNLPGDENYIRQSNILLSPLGQGSRNAGANAVHRWLIEESRLDIADTTIREFREYLMDELISELGLIRAFDYRFNCKPWATRVPPGDKLIKMGNEMALTAPFLQRGVSQFVVEYAGDFIRQDPKTGTMNGLGPDGEIDYVLIPDPKDYPDISTFAKVARATKKIRWYGMPRNVDLRNDLPNGLPSIPTDRVLSLISEDVLPLRDVVPPNDNVAQKAVGMFERFTFWNPNAHQILESTFVPRPKDYANFKNPQPGMNLAYYCNWSANELQNPSVGVPSMIRIVMTLSDVNGRLPEGQTVEYVFKLAQ